MSAFFRSEKMSLCQMVLHKESAFDCMAELGTLGLVQFENIADEHHVASLRFINEVKRCNEIQRILHHLQTGMKEYDMHGTYYLHQEDEIPRAEDLKVIEQKLQSLEQELNDVEKNYEALLQKKASLIEKWHVLAKVSDFLHGERNTESVMAWSDSVVMKLLRDETQHREETAHYRSEHLRLGFIAGSIPMERFQAFEMMLWRICHSNFYMRQAEIEVPLEDVHRHFGLVRKYAFVLFFQGNVMRHKIAKLCQGFRVTLYECPESREDRMEKRLIVGRELEDMKVVVAQSDDERQRLLLLAATDFYQWKLQVSKILMIYFNLNKLAGVKELRNDKYLQAQCWIPTSDIPTVRQALLVGAKRSSKGDDNMIFPPILTVMENAHGTKLTPTFFRLNRFTRGFQNLIDSYGIAAYQELNPAPYTIVTFPFLFGVMFGDMGHGFIMALFGIWMVVKEDELERKNAVATNQSEIWNILFAGRYIILLMGIFSVYTGLIYNDIFSKSFNIFGSKWRVNYNFSTVSGNKILQLDPARPEFYLGTPYIFGMDPVWDASGEESIVTFNSLKMKLSIILGITQMMFGLCLSAANHIHEINNVDLYLVCLPQFVFLLCLFVYLCFLIIYKWALYGGHNETPLNSACAPSVLIIFIDMILMKDSAPPPPGCEHYMFDGQDQFQVFLLAIALICVPVLLAGKPLYFMYQQRSIRKIKDQIQQEELRRNTDASVRRSLVYNPPEPSPMHMSSLSGSDKKKAQPPPPPQDDHANLGELWIHSGIHCIESVLGSVSHTASYLRLWALSLAHDQLSTVLWDLVLRPALTSSGFASSFFLFVVFSFWAILTLAILVTMEALSAFLHTLRLHWVEFQSKFYEGSGELFMPLHFPKIGPRD